MLESPLATPPPKMRAPTLNIPKPTFHEANRELAESLL